MSNSGTPKFKRDKLSVAAREAECLRRYNAGENLVDIGHALGYSGDDNAVKATAYGLLMRALRKRSLPDAADVVSTELARLDELHASWWPAAIGDLSIVPQWQGKGKNRRRVICEEDDPDEPDHKHFEDGTGALQCWVIPGFAKVQGSEKILQIMERRSKYLGLDFKDGLDARKQALEEQTAHTLAGVLGYILKAMNPTPEQQMRAEQAFMEQLQLAGNEPKAITVETTP